ncbi:hypothetical protein L211DRAFT_207035 [Terfezia boudieri ATCC MYA-4762]|uniref:Uncharacterized protein n=1 Tax=Terfezia boudieri ATCC MYA-4762 TaxID=1051890 RepID=A0A3N4M1C4_9PEZI|nr:hypothetical protein L211DRAFT_207035 [Terfezia boudieri ATCC MYA-4762]
MLNSPHSLLHTSPRSFSKESQLLASFALDWVLVTAHPGIQPVQYATSSTAPTGRSLSTTLNLTSVVIFIWHRFANLSAPGCWVWSSNFAKRTILETGGGTEERTCRCILDVVIRIHHEE